MSDAQTQLLVQNLGTVSLRRMFRLDSDYTDMDGADGMSERPSNVCLGACPASL